MADVSWSHYDDDTCIRIGGLTPDATVLVRPCTGARIDRPPATIGQLVRDGDDVCFVPRYAFVDGTPYAVFVDGVEVATVVRPQAHERPSTEVLAIFPTAAVVPRNLLRFYVWFSTAMSEGDAAGHIRLVDDDGAAIPGALLPSQHELWDVDRRRLTVLLDPARIKRGLVAHREAGYPLETGGCFRLAVDPGFSDARGIPLREPAERRYAVGGDERRRVEPDRWALSIPSADSLDPIVVTFDRPLDHGLLARCIHVVGPDGGIVRGFRDIGPEEKSWSLAPDAPWTLGSYDVVVDPILEDLAGNSVARVFDRDLTRAKDDPHATQPVRLGFTPR